MTFNLTYRKGSVPQSDGYISLLGAIGGASIVLETAGCFGLAIDEDGRPLMAESEILNRLDEIAPTSPVSPHAGRPPQFRR